LDTAMKELSSKMKKWYGTNSTQMATQGKLNSRRLRLDNVDMGKAAH
jgi:hypothetical protein